MDESNTWASKGFFDSCPTPVHPKYLVFFWLGQLCCLASCPALSMGTGGFIAERQEIFSILVFSPSSRSDLLHIGEDSQTNLKSNSSIVIKLANKISKIVFMDRADYIFGATIKLGNRAHLHPCQNSSLWRHRRKSEMSNFPWEIRSLSPINNFLPYTAASYNPQGLYHMHQPRKGTYRMTDCVWLWQWIVSGSWACPQFP